MAQKILITKKGKTFFVKDDSKDMHTQYGFIRAKELSSKTGTHVKTNKDVEMSVLDPCFLDKLKKIKRGAQIIPLKDIGSIIAETSLDRNSTVVDAGAGSGYMALFFSNIVKKVTTYDIREDHLDTAKKNIEFMGMKNTTPKLKDIRVGIDEKEVDLVNLDLPEPWECIDSAYKALKLGGFIVSYSPTIPQTMDFVQALKQNGNFLIRKTIEIIEREWEISGRKVRPMSQSIGHSGFLTFARKIT